MRAVFLSALVGFVWVLAASACGSATETQPAAAVGPDSTDTRQITVGFNMKMTEAGVMKADLFGDTAITRPGETRTEIRKVRLTFWDQGEGKAPSKLTSRTGEYDQGSGVMVARGNVVLVVPGEKGKGTRTIRTEELHYDQRGDRVWSDRETVIEEATRTLVTQGFTSDSRFTNITGNNARTIGGVPVSGGGVGL